MTMVYAFELTGGLLPRVAGFALPSETSYESRGRGIGCRPAQTINFSPDPHHGRRLCSRASIAKVVGISAFSSSDETNDISGIAFAYRTGPPIVLGQARKKCGSFWKQSTDDVREIFVYYETSFSGRRITGVRFFTWSSHKMEFGNCSRSCFEILRPPPNTADFALVWRFTHVSSDLALEDSNAD